MNDKGFLIGPSLAGKLKTVIEHHDQSVHKSFVPRAETRFEDIPRRAAATSTIRLGQCTGEWRNEPPLNIKAVQLFKQLPNSQPWQWVPETDEYGDPVFAVTINWFSHIPVGQGDLLKWCAVVPISNLAGEYDTGQVTYEDGQEIPIMKPYSKLWLLLAVEC